MDKSFFKTLCLKILISCRFISIFPFSVESKEVEITILQTTDIHAHYQNHTFTQKKGSWLQLATLIKRERKNAGGGMNSLLIDCGDTIQGTLAGSFAQGQISLVMLDSLKYDAWILGNHDLDFGIHRLKELISMAQTPVINGNLKLKNFRTLPPYKIYDKAGAKIAVIGMNSAFLNFWLWGEKMKGFEVEKAALTIERILPEVMRLNPDLIILGLHQGLLGKDKRNVNEVKAIANRFPQIDLILGGHTHRKFPGNQVGNSWYIQAGKHGNYLGKILVKIDLKKNEIISIQSQLLSSTKEQPDRRSLALIEPWLNQAREFAEQKICFIDRAIGSSGLPGRDCYLSEVICRSISAKTSVPIVLHGTLSNTSWKKNSILDEKKLFETIPYENGIGIAYLTEEELKIIVEEQLHFKNHWAFNGIFGFYAEVDSKTSNIKTIRIPHKPNFKNTDRIAVAFNSYVIAGAGARFPLLRNILNQSSSRLKDTGYLTRDVLRDYLLNSEGWKIPPEQWLQTSSGLGTVNK